MKKRVALNVISSGSQVFFVGVVYFFLYKFLLKKLGIEILGVWSVVLATSSLANLANFGVATSVVRYVALYSKETDQENIKKLIFTAALFLFLLFVLLSGIIIPFAGLILKHVIAEKYMADAMTILPYSIACLIINAVGGIYASVLDGFQKNYLRSIVFTVSSLLLLILTYFLVAPFGLKGVAMAQVAQSLFTLVVCLFIVVKFIRHNPLKWRWDKAIFKEIFAYGIKFQAISVCNMLNEPVTKILLSKFGGLAFTGYFEMANRLVMQVRGVIVNGNQSLIPVIVGASDDSAKNINIYQKSLSFTLLSSLLFITSLCFGARIISFYWVGHFEPVFINNVLLLGFALFINLLCAPAYFAFMANGSLLILLKSHLIMGLLNVILGLLLGWYIGGYGATIGWLAGVSIGSIYLIKGFLIKNEVKTSTFTARDMKCVIAAVGLLIVQYLMINQIRIFENIKNQIALAFLFVLILSAILLKAWSGEIKALITKNKDPQN